MKQILEAAEYEKLASYIGRRTLDWLEDLAPLGTNWQKPFLEKAPYKLLPVGYAAQVAIVSDLQRRSLEEISIQHDPKP